MPDDVRPSGLPIPSPLIEFILLGPLDDRRQLQDSPILGDVWVEFGRRPSDAINLLIAPYRGEHAGRVAADISDGLTHGDNPASIAYVQGLIAASLTFEEVLRIVVPKTKWWIKHLVPRSDPITDGGVRSAANDLIEQIRMRVTPAVTGVLNAARDWNSKSGTRRLQEIPTIDRFIALAGLILWAGRQERLPGERTGVNSDEQISDLLLRADADEVSARLREVLNSMRGSTAETTGEGELKPLIWQVSLNRSAMPALNHSGPAVKADAARTLFSIDCSDIAWAVIDSGIDGSHPAFSTADGKRSRVVRSFDFKNFRTIVNLSNARDSIRAKNVDLLMSGTALRNPPDDPDGDLKRLADDARSGGPIRWEMVERFVEIDPRSTPPTSHGTHVAGILGASMEAARSHSGSSSSDDFADGMCPDISLFDFRVLGPGIRDTEFAIIAALQYIRYLNGRDNFFTIHGANLSLSIPHDVRNFACGRTPICNECERLVESGVVVVAAAGNHGYKSFETRDGVYDGYAAFSITDPGNSDSVITVGATHRFWPHTYGVSFFSSRGPTGDGRFKPDLVAPGERILGPVTGNTVPGGNWGELDGTSMAAPHVSGAAAMLMARYSELIGQPRRIKQILCESATDLERERTFQGHGMLDVLRALQSI